MSENRVVAIFTVFLSFILFIAMKPGDNPEILLRIVSIVTVIVFIGTILYTRFLWRIPPFNMLHRMIDISGKWKGCMEFQDGEVYEVETVIVQYLDDVNIKIKTNNFLNDSLICKMKLDANGAKLYAVYKSKPNGKVDSKEQIEYGTFIINCDEDFLEGLFFTSSKEVGELELYRK